MSKVTSLKVFLEYDTTYEIYVAQCLQTGHLVTADDPDTAKEMITELLEDEVSDAIRRLRPDGIDAGHERRYPGDFSKSMPYRL